MPRNASAKWAGSPLSSSGSADSSLRVQPRHDAQERQAQLDLDFVGVLDAVVDELQRRTRAPAPPSCRRKCPEADSWACWAGRGCEGAGLRQRRGCCWSSARQKCRSPWPAASALRKSVCCSPPHASARCTRCPCGSEPGRRSSVTSSSADRLRSWACADRNSLRTDCTTLAISPSSLAWVLAIAEASFTMSGWFCPRRSSICACWRWRSESWDFRPWMNVFERTTGKESIAARLAWRFTNWL